MEVRLRSGPETAFVIALSMLLAACGRDIGAAKYAETCRRVALTDAETGKTIVGAEDMAVDPAGERLYIAAYDRRAAERAAREGAMSIPEGGVYAVALSAVFDPATAEVKAAPVVAQDAVSGGIRPHGISFDAATGEIAFINRSYTRINGDWRMTARIERVGDDQEAGAAVTPCAANDLLVESGDLVVSFDHGACGWRAGLEDVLGLKRSGLANAAGASLFDGAAFANGVVRTLGGDLALAATRERALVMMREIEGQLTATGRIALPGGPDNLSLAADGGVVAAVHPSLFRTFLHRRLGLGAAPSRIVKVDPEKGAVELLFDDASGKLFAAATVGLEAAGGLVAGSATDAGLLVCRAGA